MLRLDGVLVCLSNWHVFCVNGNSTLVGYPLELGFSFQRIAHLHAFYEVRPNASNLWDFALGAIDDPSAVLDQMRPCDDGFVYPLPRGLAASVNVGDPCHKVGAGLGAPTCRQGSLRGITSVRVDYGSFGQIWFEDQLLFQKMTDPGDSGAVISSNTDNKVVGLNFAGNNTDTVANPIYKLGWRFQGTFVVGNVELPSFASRPSADLTEQKFIHASTLSPGDDKGSFRPLDFPDLTTPSLPPIFKVNAVLTPPGGNPARLKQLIGEWGYFENTVGTGFNGWVHIPSVAGPWA
jgi:hypothetical protein